MTPEQWQRKYGKNYEWREEKIAAQNGKCAICTVEPIEATDHCHSCTNVRGLLCRGCNIGLGAFKDSILALRAAAEYLEQHYEEMDKLVYVEVPSDTTDWSNVDFDEFIGTNPNILGD